MDRSEDFETIIEDISLRSDENAFRHFFDHYYARLLRFAYFLIKSDELAKEIVSDVFIKIWNNRAKLIHIEKMDYYMFKATRNQSLTYIGKLDMNLDDLEILPETAVIHYKTPENMLLNQELTQKIEKSISNLPLKCQTIFRLSREDGFKFSEIAGILEISESTVKNQVTIALKKLKADLNDYFERA